MLLNPFVGKLLYSRLSGEVTIMFFGGRKMGQTWSFDLLIAVVIFIIIVGVFYAFLSTNEDKSDPESLQEEAKTVSRLLDCDASPSDFCILQNGEIIESRLNALAAMTPEELADRGISGDYCIYFEDNDGNIIPINGTKVGIGSPEFEIAPGIPCNGTI